MATIESTSCGSSATNIGLSMGPVLIGAWISLVLYGISLLQCFIYFLSYPKDTFSVKLMVVVVLTLDTAHKFLLCAGIWNRLIQHYGDILNFFVIQSPMLFAPPVTSLVSVIVQSYFAYRVWFLSKGLFKWIFPAVLMPFIIAQPGECLLVIILYCTVKAWKVSVFEVTSNSMLMNTGNASTGIAAAVDIVIAIAMCTLLAMGRTGFSEKTDQMLLRLIVISLNTGLWTAILALLSIILLVSLPSTETLYTGFYYPICSLYCNTLLANLNIRPYLRGGEQVYPFPVAPTSTNRSTAPTTSFMLDITAENSKAAKLASFAILSSRGDLGDCLRLFDT
ncbi:hypothetical protein BU15DRAFT_69060 [Melanogaster broomeanus]|nr:hypothetical protein BU15DRAFT_69060 [Melanogaster broomeanus]